jgi:hypothetical protein
VVLEKDNETLKGGTWSTTTISKDELTELMSKKIKISDAYGMKLGDAQRVLQWAIRNGYPRAHITNRDNGLHGVGLN